MKKACVLLFNNLALLPGFKQLWSYYRKRQILFKHRKVTRFWKQVIAAYFNGHTITYNIKEKKSFETSKIIWQYWAQGFCNEDIPEVVNACLASVEKYRGEYLVIRLDDKNFSNYIDFPDFLIEKKNKGEMSNAYFSDILRLALLKTYGGIWLDATILLTGSLTDYPQYGDYFVFQRDFKEKNKKYWERRYAYYWGWYSGFKVRMLNSIFYAKKESEVVTLLLYLMLNYWKDHDSAPDYFFFQILYEVLIDEKVITNRCIVVSDVIPHLLQTKFDRGIEWLSYEEIMDKSSIHKLSYKGQSSEEFRLFIKNYMGKDRVLKNGTREEDEYNS